MNMGQTSGLLLGIFFLVCLVILKAVRLSGSGMTTHELERRAKAGTVSDQKALEREQLLPDLLTFRRIIETLLSVVVVVCFVSALGWLVGVIVSVIAMLELGMLARLKPVGTLANKFYQKYEVAIVAIVSKLRPLLKFTQDVSDMRPADFSLHSREELLHLVDEATLVLTDSERYLLASALKFEDQEVNKIMTPRSVIETVEASEVLGPIVLDRLYKNGHSRFPVIKGDLDHVIGLLYVHDLLEHARSAKKSTAKQLMEPTVYYINENQPLPSALAGFLRARHHLFIVVNEFEETTGVITLEDVLEALIGRKIVDEFDQYDDLRAVAKRAAALRHKSADSTHIT
jgi:CBS domain containing-hemolysin-like protein